ncbi:hypothetical protein GF356_00980 [candidate division GN15 bacterium]|nr:hypothetical protein [candidate division GN15 bacterium]
MNRGDSMQCPECKSELIEEHYSSVAVDRCVGCNGYWFDRNEVEAFARSKKTVLKRKSVDESDFLSVTNIPAGPCPRCSGGTLEVGLFKGLSFSRCNQCRGFFLTEEQIQLLVTEAQPENDHNSPGFAIQVGDVAAEGAFQIALDAALGFVVSILFPS